MTIGYGPIMPTLNLDSPSSLFLSLIPDDCLPVCSVHATVQYVYYLTTKGGSVLQSKVQQGRGGGMRGSQGLFRLCDSTV